jgi:hypothetical protein
MTAPTTVSLQQIAEQKRVATAIEREQEIQNPTPPRPVLPKEVTPAPRKAGIST